MRIKAKFNLICAGAIAGTIAACGGSSYNSPDQAQSTYITLNGTAAAGAAISNASVSIQCQGATGSTTTKSDGTFTVNISGGTLPCALGLTNNGQSLRSIVVGSGNSATANITPLTEMQRGALLKLEPNAVGAGAPSSALTSDKLKAAQDKVIDYLKANGIDVASLANVDFVSTPLAAATSTPGSGDSQDKVLDNLRASGVDTASVATILSTAPAGCPYVRSGKFTLITYTGETTSAMIDFTAMTIVVGSGASASFAESSANPCEFTGGTVTVNFATSGLAIFKDTTSKVIGIALPYQAFNKAAIVSDTYNLSGYFANNSGPAALNANLGTGAFAPPNAQFGTMLIKADATAIVCGGTDYSTTTNPDACPVSTPAKNAQTANFGGTLNDDGSVTMAGSTKAFSYIAPNGKKLIVEADSATHTFLLIAKQVPIDTTRIEPNSVWYQIQGYSAYSGINDTGSWVDNAAVSSGTSLTVATSATQGTTTLHFDDGVTPDRTDTIYWNTTTDSGATKWNGMRHRNKDTGVAPRTGMNIVDMGLNTNGSVNGGTLLSPTAPSTASFTLLVKRYQK